VSREVIFKNEITDVEISINENEREEIINNLSEITNETDLDKEDESVSSYYSLRNREQNRTKPIRHYACTAFTAEPINYNEAINCMHADKWENRP